jgi:uncharacterized protein (TIGR02145 family)
MKKLFFVIGLVLLLTGCEQATPTAILSTPTHTQVPPITTSLPPTETKLPTATFIPTTETPPPTAPPGPTDTSSLTPTSTPPPTLDGRGGGVLAFVSERTGSPQIYLMNADGSGLQQLTDDQREHWYPHWSPDGSMLAFHSHRNDSIWSIYKIDADGTNLTRLTSEETRDASPVWSPDGTLILFSRDESLWVMNADGSDPQQLTEADYPSCCADWSPDGTQIAFESTRDGNGEIYIMDADGSNPRRLTHDEGEDWWPDWSPDSSQIAFKSDRDGDFEIYVIDADCSNLRQLTDNNAEDGEPDWSPDGTLIAFESNRNNGFNIYVMNADGSDQQQLTNQSTRDILPVWKPAATEMGSPIIESQTSLQPDGTGTVNDVDGNLYPIIKIGDQWWMAASLNVTQDPHGEPITGYCYNNDEENCNIYGYLYTWDTVMNGATEEEAQGICPAGWHLPGDNDWAELVDFLGGEDVAGGKMKAVGTELWRPPNKDATNSSGFNGLPAGGYMVAMDLFEGLGVGVHFWSSTEYGSSRAGIPTLHKNEAAVTWLVELKTITASVRCVKD